MQELKRPLYYGQAACDTMMRKFEAAALPPVGRFHYHQGVFLSGMHQIYELCGKEEYFQYIKDWIDSNIDENGEIHNCHSNKLDDIMPGNLLFPLLERYDDETYEKLLHKLVPIVLNFFKNEVGGFWHMEICPDQMWLDGLYMGGPICAKYSKKYGKPEYLESVIEQIRIMHKYTVDEETGLWYHAWDCSKKADWADPVTGKSSEFWGRSIGWVTVAGMIDLDYIPEDHKDRAEIEKIVVDLIKAVCKYQSEDGRWYQVVDKGHLPENWLENSCSCLYTASICKAVAKGLLDESYLEIARKGFEGVINSLTWNGDDIEIGNVCIGTCVGDYAHYCARPTSTNDLHGVGAFLIMCAEAEKVL